MADLLIPVTAGLTNLQFSTNLQFQPGSTTGRDPNTRPGIGFLFITDMVIKENKEMLTGKFYGGSGVIDRVSAQKLADMLNKFLAEHPPADIGFINGILE